MNKYENGKTAFKRSLSLSLQPTLYFSTTLVFRYNSSISAQLSVAFFGALRTAFNFHYEEFSSKRAISNNLE